MILRGLYPNTPLGFLTGLGALRILDGLEPESEWELRWRNNAEIRCSSEDPSKEKVSSMLAEYLEKGDPMFEQEYSKEYDKYEKFIKYVETETKNSENFFYIRRLYDFAACLAFPEKNKKGKREVKKTRFDFSTGHASLFENIKKLSEKVNDKEIHKVLFEEWNYDDNGIIMGWDPVSSQRQHAKTIHEPSKSFNPSTHAANRIAVEAVSLYPTIQNNRRVKTIGWNNDGFLWPIWKEYAGLDEIRGMLDINYELMDKEQLDKIGIEIYCSDKKLIDRQFRFGYANKYLKS